MALSVTHTTQSTVTDEQVPGEIGPNDWNATHTIGGTLDAAQFPALTGDVTTSAGSLATTLATVNGNVGTFGSATQSIQVTYNAKGLATAVANVTVTPAVGSITGLGAGVGTFLATPSSANLAAALTDETGTGAAVFANSPTLVTPALGTPASGVLTNCTGLPTTGLADDAVTFAKIQNITTDRLLGRDTASTGDPEEISLNATLEFTGAGAIQRAALTGDVTVSAGSNATTLVQGSSSFALTGDISPAQITADQNDYNPTGLSTASTLRLSSDAARNVTGLAGGSDGRIIIVHNVGAQNIVLKDESVSSTAGNRFALTGDLTLAADAVAVLQYDSTSSRWRAVSGGGGSGSGDVVGPASSTDNAAARFDLTTGKLIQNSALLIADTTGDLSRSGGGGIDIEGTNTNDSAAAGYVGEYLPAGVDAASSVTLTNNTAANVTSLSITAGDWDVTAFCKFDIFNSTCTNIICAISTTSATLPGDTTTSTMREVLAVAMTDNTSPHLGGRAQRVSIASTTTYYMVARAGWSGADAVKVWGLLSARRVR